MQDHLLQRTALVLVLISMTVTFTSALTPEVRADVPLTINYQGVLTDTLGAPVPDGDYDVTFAIYDAAAPEANQLWTSGPQAVDVTDGSFSYHLGQAVQLPNDLFATDTTRYLGIQIGSDPEIKPRTKLTSVPYAFHALRADTANVALSGSSGWKDEGTVIRLENGTDSVGIGTSEPSEKLDVDGNIHASGTIKSGNTIIINGVAQPGQGSTIEVENPPELDIMADQVRISGKLAVGPGHDNSGDFAFVAGEQNEASGTNSVVSGGKENTASAISTTVGGGHLNTATQYQATVSGGLMNEASGASSTISGGAGNTASVLYATICGGSGNIASGYPACFIGGGEHNRARGAGSVVCGGGGANLFDSNAAIGSFSVVPGGTQNVAGGDYSFAAGRRARVRSTDHGTFVWADHTDNDFRSTGEDQFLIRAGGGVGIGTASPDPNAALTIEDDFKVLVGRKTSGEIIVEIGQGFDYSEVFPTTGDDITQGTVLAIDLAAAGRLAACTQPYDRKVAGVVAGAKGLDSGVKLGQSVAEQGDHAVALAGRVYCNVDTQYGDIEPGDLLTTSPTPGHAMVVKDFSKAQGAVLGKAMEGLSGGGVGQILTLISLQ